VPGGRSAKECPHILILKEHILWSVLVRLRGASRRKKGVQTSSIKIEFLKELDGKTIKKEKKHASRRRRSGSSEPEGYTSCWETWKRQEAFYP